MAKIVSVKFKKVGKSYYFDPLGIDFEVGDGVIVETVRGVEFGEISQAVTEIDDSKITSPLKPVIRKATEDDFIKFERNRARAESAEVIAKEKVEKHGLDMKIIDSEYTFDGAKLVFYFTSDGRVDFRELVKDLASTFHTRIELLQVGIRDEARSKGGIASCGRVCCCASCLPDFARVSVKMAKTQGLSLNPTKISGLCGRLMCCLSYENEYYADVSKMMPVVGSVVSTPDGDGIVASNNLLKLTSRVKIEKADGSVEYKDFGVAELKASKTLDAEIEESVDANDQSDDISGVLADDNGKRNDKRRQQRNDRPRNDFKKGEGRPLAERGERSERPERQDKRERFERPERPERQDRGERSERFERPERQEKRERPERPERQERGDQRPERGFRKRRERFGGSGQANADERQGGESRGFAQSGEQGGENRFHDRRDRRGGFNKGGKYYGDRPRGERPQGDRSQNDKPPVDQRQPYNWREQKPKKPTSDVKPKENVGE